jgi:hypothetical protein
MDIYVAVLHRVGLDNTLLKVEVLGADVDPKRALTFLVDRMTEDVTLNEEGGTFLSLSDVRGVTLYKVTMNDPKEIAYKRAWDWLANRVKESAEGWKGQEEKYEEDGALRSRHHAGGQASALSHIVEEMDEARETFGLD